MSGNIIDLRDQVLIGLRSLFATADSTFFARCWSMNGPFFRERGTFAILFYSVLSALICDDV
jgi:hypothetical protein